ncbi:MAG: PBP1A family penicillin-binding protein [Candidatus Paceibacterota bacterium]
MSKIKHLISFKKIKHSLKKPLTKKIIHLGLILVLLIGGIGVLWVSSLQLPDLATFDQQIRTQSTKVFDKTGQTLLYDFGNSSRLTFLSIDEISPNIKNATVSIEDSSFYTHGGIKVSSLARALIADIFSGHFSQGGSTLTQQVIKNALLTQDKTIARKIKEIVLAIKLEQKLPKDKILELYLNQTPYGGTIYGAEEASQQFFKKSAADVDIAEAAYLAALPQAPTYYSPYGKHKEALDQRKNLVLQKMKDNGYITDTEYQKAKNEVVAFSDSLSGGIKAPHFVMYIRNYIEEKYGDTILASGGLKITSTLDYDMQKKAEAVVKKYALDAATKYNATNGALVAIDTGTGQILSMVGSRDYFDKTVDGNFNVTTASRQPGSSFKPIMYVTAFNKGYTPSTVLFDTPTQFSTNSDCSADNTTSEKGCYSPGNYDGKFRGPITIRSALGQSINIPAVKMLYLVGINNVLATAKSLGITTLTDTKNYGLSLVLGGGSVNLLQMTSAYSTFAAEGVRHPYTGILKIEDKAGNVIEQWEDTPTQVLPKQSVLELTDVLSDNNARIPVFNPNSTLYFSGRTNVAAKTGTTNDYKDMWVIGYTPSITVGAWMGNNDNSPIAKNAAGSVTGPMWRAFMDEILPTLPNDQFEKPSSVDISNQKTLLNGNYIGNDGSIHSELYWINKDDPTGNSPSNPWSDPQFSRWEYSVLSWFQKGGSINFTAPASSGNNNLSVSIVSPVNNYSAVGTEKITASISSPSNLKKADYFLNGTYVGTSSNYPYSISFIPEGVGAVAGENTLKVVATDPKGNTGESSIIFIVK